MIVKKKIREFMEAAYIQCYLDQHGFQEVYVDEFHVNINSSSLKNWSPRSIPALLEISSSSFLLSFVIAISTSKIEGIMASTTSICSMTFTRFINDVWTELKRGESSMSNEWIVIDNWSVQKCKNAKDFVKRE